MESFPSSQSETKKIRQLGVDPGLLEALHSLYAGRKLAIATKHGKEAVLGPPLEQLLGVDILVPADFDTDVFGTFSGEVERLLSPLETARRKARQAMHVSGAFMAVASEGSFGPHPALPFVPSDSELVLFIDGQRQLEVAGHALSSHTNFDRRKVKTWAGLVAFARQAGFPDHALILGQPRKYPERWLVKGIRNWITLKRTAHYGWQHFGELEAETDMRAMLNPTRMEVIGLAMEDLQKKLTSLCPSCRLPGFAVVERQEGLPCGLCGLPTRQTKAWNYRCQACNYETQVLFPEGKTEGDPTFCDYCNP